MNERSELIYGTPGKERVECAPSHPMQIMTNSSDSLYILERISTRIGKHIKRDSAYSWKWSEAVSLFVWLVDLAIRASIDLIVEIGIIEVEFVWIEPQYRTWERMDQSTFWVSSLPSGHLLGCTVFLMQFSKLEGILAT